MRIVDKADTSVEFSTIEVGECFLYDNCLFIKIHPTKEDSPYSCNAFCFVDNRIANVPSDWNVTPVDAEVVIYSKGVHE